MQADYSIPIPKDDKGYTHRLCPNCGSKFGIRWFGEIPDNLHCPYCEKSGDVKEFNIAEQLDYAVEEGKQQIFYDIQKDLQAMMRRSFAGSRNVSFKSSPIRKKYTSPPQQSEIPTDMKCSSCDGEYVIFGISAQCPYCGTEDIKILDANLATIEKELNTDRELRRTYNDIVIAFQNECRFFASANKKPNFQNINIAEKYFKDSSGIKLLENINEQNLIDMRTVFEKRHTEQHSSGVYDDKYITNLNADKSLIGKKVTYSKDELTSTLKALVVVSNNLRNNLKHS